MCLSLDGSHCRIDCISLAFINSDSYSCLVFIIKWQGGTESSMTKFFVRHLVILAMCVHATQVIAENTGSSVQHDPIEIMQTGTIKDNFPLNISQTVIVALISLVIAIIVNIIAPWANWGIEKRRLQHTRKEDLVKEWRTYITKFDFETQNFGNSTVYAAMRPYMDKDVVKRFEAQRTYFVPPDGGRGDQLFKQWASDQVSMIEKKWKLL